MKRYLAVLMLVLMSVAVSAIEWDFAGKDHGWFGSNGSKARATEEGLVLDVVADYPGLNLTKTSFSPAGLDYMAVIYTATGTKQDRGGYLFFGTDAVPGLNEKAKYFLSAIETDGKEHVLLLDLHHERGRASWYGAKAITSLRIDLVNKYRGTILVKKVAFLTGDGMRAMRGWPSVTSREWVFANTTAGWNGKRNLTVTTTPDGLQLKPYDTYPNISIHNIRLDPKDADYMMVTYRSRNLPDRTGGYFFFATDTVASFNEAQKFYVGSLTSDGQEHVLYVPMSGPGTAPWQKAKYISDIRFDLVCNATGDILLKSIKYISKDEYIKINQQKYEALGIPFTTKVELPEKAAAIVESASPKSEYSFTSKMAAPAGAFDTIGDHYIRVEFELKELPKHNLVQSMCDDQLEALYLNGQLFKHEWSSMWSEMDSVELPEEMFRVGRNVLAVKYQNTGSVGGLMMDLQMTDATGKCQVVAVSDGVGSSLKAADGWEKLDFAANWKHVDTRPGPPNAPWSNAQVNYQSLEAAEGIVTVKAVAHNDLTADVVFTGKPAFKPTDVFYYRVKNTKGTQLSGMSGTVEELGGERRADGSVSMHFKAYKEPLYGAAQTGYWEFGVFKRSSEGDGKLPYTFAGRAFPGQPAVLKVAQTAGGPVPMLNGKPFYFNALTNQHYTSKGAVESGMEGKNSPMNIIAFRAGGFNPAGTWWIGPDTYDFSGIDRSLSEMLAWYPDSMVGLYVWCHPGHWYDKLYPERISKAHDGSTYGYYVATVSFSNKDVQADAARAVAALVKHCEEYFGSRMVLYNLMGGISCEWQGWQAHSDKVADYNPLAVKDYIQYAADHGLKVTDIPSFETRKHGEIGPFRNPVTDLASIVYDRYYSDSVADMVLAIAKAAKEACNNNKLVGAYYGYHQEYANMRHCINGGGHNALYKMLASPYMDFFLSPQSYGIRALGAPNADMKPYGAIRAAGKFSILEDDVRTHLVPATGYNQTMNLEHTLTIFKRNHGMQLSRKMPLNQLPLVGGNELNDPEIRKLFARTLKAGQYLMEQGDSPVPEIAAVIDEDAIKYLRVSSDVAYGEPLSGYQYSHSGIMQEGGISIQPVTGELMYHQRYPLAQIGATVDIITLPDVAKMAGRYKMVIFLNSFVDSSELREAFAALRKSNTKIVMTYGTGFIGEKGVDVSGMSRLAGMKFTQLPKGMLKVAFPEGGVCGNTYSVDLRFAVDDAAAKPLASYCDNGKTAVAEKDGVIFYGGALLDAAFLRKAARACGVHIFSDSGDNLHAGAGVVTIHANHAGHKTIRLPKAADVVDVYSGEVVAKAATAVEFDMKAFETRVLLCGDAEKILKALK